MDCARSIGEGSSMDIVITRSGETKYTFRDSQESCACAALRHCKEKSWGITSTSGALMGHQMVENVADAVLPVGSERQRVCMKCFTVSKSIKIREDCPSISFCSNKCLEASSLLLDDCGLLITSIRDWSRSEQFAESGQYADLAVLAVIVLYNSSLTKNIRGLHNGV